MGISLSQKLLALKKRELELIKHRRELEEVLPHLYVPMYAWQRRLHDSTNRVNLLTASNQSGKSSALIRRLIANCTDKARWEMLWGLKNKYPTQFWYFYPDGSTIEKEIDTKWVPEWLPRGRMEKDPQYGWQLARKNQTYASLTFRAGPIVYFQAYTKKVQNIQSSSVYEAFVDEELPMAFYDEIMFRLMATSGIFTSGFTPTLNQIFWREAMETKPEKILPSALKLQISMYDCLKYEDGSPSRVMSLSKIHEAESKCKNDTEKQRRIFGRFVTEQGRVYYAFDYETHVTKAHDVSNWTVYASVDYGSGDDTESVQKGKKNHPAGIVFLAVSPDYKRGAVIKSWRGDLVKTTAGDVFTKYMELREGLHVTQACYDPGSRDFGTIAERNGVSFQKADKSRDSGQDLLNTLFHHGMLTIFEEDPENLKLAGELLTNMITSSTMNKKDDDLADALRYNVMQVPWDLSVINEKRTSAENAEMAEKKARPMTEAEHLELQIKLRRGESVRGYKGEQSDEWNELEEEFEHWNDQYG